MDNNSMERLHFQSYAPSQGRGKGSRCRLPHQGVQGSISALPAPWLGERRALAKLWLLILFKVLMARHPWGVPAGPWLWHACAALPRCRGTARPSGVSDLFALTSFPVLIKLGLPNTSWQT